MVTREPVHPKGGASAGGAAGGGAGIGAGASAGGGVGASAGGGAGDGDPGARGSGWRYLGPAIFGFGGTAILVLLCIWQLQRLEWKEALIARIEARVAAAPVALPAAPDPEADAYLPVAAQGRLGAPELHVLTSVRQGGPGYLVIAPFETDSGRRVLVDRGFVPEADKDLVRPLGDLALVGNLVWPNETDGFTPDPDTARNIWFARDVARMAAALETEPLMIVARSRTGADEAGSVPRPVPVSIDIVNNHRQYAFTWGTMAVLWLAMTLGLLLRLRGRPA